MALLVTTNDAFEAQLLAARLGSDGLLTELRGAVGGPYPGVGAVYLYVREADLVLAQALVESTPSAADEYDDGDDHPVRRGAVPWLALLAVGLILATVVARVF
jgi:hypothetical protein